MPCLSDDLRSLSAAEGYAALGLYHHANEELERMPRETRAWPEVLAIKLAIFSGLQLWEMVEIAAFQLRRSAAGNPRWTSLAESARRATRPAPAGEPLRLPDLAAS